MTRKVTIIGAGSVGSTIAYTMAVNGLASEIVMIDVNHEKALGEAMDILQGTPFCSPIKIYAGSYAEAADSDIVIVTSGVARKPGQTRIDLAQTNVNIVKAITPEITKYAPNAIYIFVANPVDVLTYVFHKISGIPENRIIGSGTILDTARLRSRLAELMEINQKNVHAYVLGEHGDSSFVPWSCAQIAGVNLDDYRASLNYATHEYPDFTYEEVEDYMRTSGAKVISRKGATFYAVAISVCHIVRTLFSSVNTVLSVSTMMHGEYGVEDVCISVPTIIGPTGVCGNVLPPLTEEELAKFHNSANVLKGVISQPNI